MRWVKAFFQAATILDDDPTWTQRFDVWLVYHPDGELPVWLEVKVGEGIWSCIDLQVKMVRNMNEHDDDITEKSHARCYKSVLCLPISPLSHTLCKGVSKPVRTTISIYY